MEGRRKEEENENDDFMLAEAERPGGNLGGFDGCSVTLPFVIIIIIIAWPKKLIIIAID